MNILNALVAKHTKRLEGELEALKKQFPNPAVAFNICVWNELIKQAARIEAFETEIDKTWCNKCADETPTWDGDCTRCNLSKPIESRKGNA